MKKEDQVEYLNRMSKGILAITLTLKEVGLDATEATAALMITIGLAAEANGITDEEYVTSLKDARKAAAILVKALRDKGLLPAGMPGLGFN